MQSAFDIIVIGAGMMGSAAARHLAEQGQKVALIGPAEPDDKLTHSGVFASHYDQARITRSLDPRADWAAFSTASIGRYRDMERRSGQQFFHEVGALIVGPEHGDGSDFVQATAQVGARSQIAHEVVAASALPVRFPYFDFPTGVLALYEAKGAGYINPRAHVEAELALGRIAGVALIRAEVGRVEETTGSAVATCTDGRRFSASKVIIAAGAFSKAPGLLPQPIPLTVYARSVAFIELGAEEAARLKHMPSLIYLAPDLSFDVYVLPPVRYPDGKIYLKLGGDPVDVELRDSGEIQAWFHGGGDAKAAAFLTDALFKFMPGLRYESLSHGPCVTAFTPTHKPLIYSQTPHILTLAGGNGAGAKCADELGRLAAELALNGTIAPGQYKTDFRP